MDVLAVETSAVEGEGRQLLSFSLRNVSGTPLQIRSSQLPWNGRGELLVLGAELDGLWSALRSAYPPVRSTANEIVVIRPGEVVRGATFLDERISNLDEALQRGEVAVFWLYEPHTSDDIGLGRYAGVTVFPRGGVRTGRAESYPIPKDRSTMGQLSIEASPAFVDGAHALKFTVTNLSKSELTIPVRMLPWSYPSNAVVVAASRDGSMVLRSLDPGSALPYGQSVIAPNRSLSGFLQLDQRIPEIESAISGNDIVVFWSAIDPNDSARHPAGWSGFAVIPKGGLRAH
jgi:hypothetical protein